MGFPSRTKKLQSDRSINEEACAEISLGGKKDVDKAVGAAKKAFSTWAFSKKEERLELLEKLYVIYKKRWAEMAKLITLEMGAPMKFSTEMQAATGASHIKSFKQVLKDFKFERDLGEEKNNQKLLYEPKGVCALITPWNWPMNQVSLKVIPALASACTIVLKPSEIPNKGFSILPALPKVPQPKPKETSKLPTSFDPTKYSPENTPVPAKSLIPNANWGK